MKVNTDGVLLGALMTVRPASLNVLDVGTGTGTVALMAAQRYADLHSGCFPENFSISAIDIDAPSADEAASNFRNSPWGQVLSSLHSSLEEYSGKLSSVLDGNGSGIDHIFSNPPYFEGDLHSPDIRRHGSRHSDSMSYRELLEFAGEWLSPEGLFSVILPSMTEADLCRHARMNGLFPSRIVDIKTVPAKPPRRIVAEFTRARTEHIVRETLTIQEKGRYTGQYISLTSDFYLFPGL